MEIMGQGGSVQSPWDVWGNNQQQNNWQQNFDAAQAQQGWQNNFDAWNAWNNNQMGWANFGANQAQQGWQNNFAQNQYNDQAARMGMNGFRWLNGEGQNIMDLKYTGTGQKRLQTDFGNLFGAGGAGGGAPGAWGGATAMPGYVGGDYAAWSGGGMDVTGMNKMVEGAIDANQPWFQEQAATGMANVANRLGAAGMLGSSAYANELGAVQRKVNEDYNRVAMDYRYNAAESAAARQLEAQQNQYDRELQAYNAAQALTAQDNWNQNSFNQNNWLNQNQWDFNAWAQQGDWNMQNQAMQNAWMNQILGSVMGGGY